MLVFEILTFQKGVIGEICLGADFVRANLMVPGSILHGGGAPRLVSDRIPPEDDLNLLIPLASLSAPVRVSCLRPHHFCWMSGSADAVCAVTLLGKSKISRCSGIIGHIIAPISPRYIG